MRFGSVCAQSQMFSNCHRSLHTVVITSTHVFRMYVRRGYLSILINCPLAEYKPNTHYSIHTNHITLVCWTLSSSYKCRFHPIITISQTHTFVYVIVPMTTHKTLCAARAVMISNRLFIRFRPRDAGIQNTSVSCENRARVLAGAAAHDTRSSLVDQLFEFISKSTLNASAPRRR